MKNTKKNKAKSKSNTSSGEVQYPPFSLNHLFINGFIRDVGQLSANSLNGIYNGIHRGIVLWGYEWFNGRLVMVFYPNFI